MNNDSKTALKIAFVAIVMLLVLFAGGTMSGMTMYGSMMTDGTMGGIGLMWVPGLLLLALGVLVGWLLFGQQE